MEKCRSAVQVSLVILFALIGAQGAGAQVPSEGPTSIGFAHPDSTQPVRAYRLPTWHWSTWTLRARGSARQRSRRTEFTDGQRSDRDTDEFDLGFTLRPNYRSLWESEER